MPGKCLAPGCKNPCDGFKSFFRFPKEPGRCHKWLRFCGLEDRIRSSQDVRDHMRICQDHFVESEYYSGAVRRLKTTALPTIHSNGTVVPAPAASSSTFPSETLQPITLSPGPSPCRHKVVRTYARKAKICANSTSNRDLSIANQQPAIIPSCSAIDGIEPLPCSDPVSSPLTADTSMPSSAAGSCDTKRRLSFNSPSSTSTPKHVNSKEALRSKVRRLEKKIQRMEAEAAEKSATCTVGQVLKATKSLLPASLHDLLAAQLNVSKFKKHGRRWDEAMKDFALSLYYHSPRSYNFVKSILNLPSVSTLRNYQKRIHISPGIIQLVLSTLKRLVDGPMADKSEKVCSLIIDEISIQQHLHYDCKADMIIGLADDGKIRLPLKADHCLMAMIKGIKRGWKQVLGYWFSNGPISSSSLVDIVQKCILDLKAIGICVKALICDQGSNNLGLASKLGVSTVKPYFELGGDKVHFFYDPPHLIKSIRNNLLRYNLIVNNNVVSWSHIKDIYNFNNDPLKLKLLPKLTKAHVYPTPYQRMKVKYAVQTLSYSVHTAIHAYVAMNRISANAVYTADFIDTMDKLFDSFNSTNLHKDKFKYRYAMCSSSKHIRFLCDVLSGLDSWKFVNCRRQPACLQGWKISIQSLLNLFHEISSDFNIPKLRTRFLSQDAIENTFSIIRQQHGCNSNPSAYQMEKGLRHLVIRSLSKLSAKSNCEKDYEYVLTKLSTLVIPEENVQESLPVCDTLDIQNMTTEDYLQPDTGEDTEDNAIYYVCGYVVKKYLASHKCEQCSASLMLREDERVLNENHQLFAFFKAFSDDFGGLCLPHEAVFRQFREWEAVFCNTFLNVYERPKISAIMQHALVNKRCIEGLCSDAALESFSKTYIKMRINWSVKFLNKLNKQDGSFVRKFRSFSNL